MDYHCTYSLASEVVSIGSIFCFSLICNYGGFVMLKVVCTAMHDGIVVFIKSFIWSRKAVENIELTGDCQHLVNAHGN